jgi:tRNA (guanine-N7-)-methyltransferase
MRLRHKKNIENIDFGNLLLKTPKIINVGPYAHTILEIGVGKGSYIKNRSLAQKDTLFVGLEYNLTILQSLIRQKQELNIDNLILINDDAKNILGYFDFGSVDEIILHFCDPWPKSRHHKRRLTYYTMLDLYYQILKSNGIIHFKTDDEDFFKDSFEYFQKKFTVDKIEYEIGEFFTEYELKKQDKNISYLRGYKK